PGEDRPRLGGQAVRLGVDRIGADRGLGVCRHSEVPSPVCPTREVNSIVISAQSPVTSSKPSTTSSPPPTYVTMLACRRTTPRLRPIQRAPIATRTNGTPSPMQYAADRAAPRPAPAVDSANDWTAPSVGPMHGVQPSPNTIPSSGAPASPADGNRWI